MKDNSIAPANIRVFLHETTKKEQSWRRKERRYRDGRSYKDGETELEAQELSSNNTVLDEVEALDLSEMLKQAIATLSETQQRRIKLFYYFGYTKTEIAEMEGVSRKNISVSIKKSLRKLKNFLK